MRTATNSRPAVFFLLSLTCAFTLFARDVDAAPPSHSSSLTTTATTTTPTSSIPPKVEATSAPSSSSSSLSSDAFRDQPYLPAQIGGIVGSYAFALVLVAVALLALSKRRREHLQAGEDEADNDVLKVPTFSFPDPQYPYPPLASEVTLPYSSVDSPKGHVRNFSYPSPTSTTFGQTYATSIAATTAAAAAAVGTSLYIHPSLSSSQHAPGIDLSVDQGIVAEDREMAQQQLEEMYRQVMEQEAAKEAGITLGQPQPLSPQQRRPSQINSISESPTSTTSTAVPTTLKREKNKPTSLNLNREEKTQSRASSILSVFSPRRKKAPQGISISSPIMTPMSGTFPRQEPAQEMNSIPPRHYAPAAPPPVPRDQVPYGRPVAPPTPAMSPGSGNIDEVLIAGPLPPHSSHQQQQQQQHSRNVSAATTEPEPTSAATESSMAPLVGLPSSPKPSVTRFSNISGPSLPSSPKPGATFARSNAPTAIRTGGALPLRAYEPSVLSPTTGAHRAGPTKQTVFERAPLSPSGLRTPFTGAAVPYTPYQPFSPVIPITPSLVTREDRKRMKKLEPKTPTVEMVKSSDEIW